jgi:hypothetical protein
MRGKSLLILFALSAAGLLAIPSQTRAASPAIDALTDQPLNKYINFAGLRTRIDKIETVKSPDGRPILQKAGGTADGTGYIMVTVTLQNPSASDTIGIPGNLLGFELADGTQIDEIGPDGYFILPSLNDPPDSLHPKQHIQIVYVKTNWNGQDITKMFLKKNSGGGENDTGYTYARFQIPKGYVTQLDPVPTPSPSPEP